MDDNIFIIRDDIKEWMHNFFQPLRHVLCELKYECSFTYLISGSTFWTYRSCVCANEKLLASRKIIEFNIILHKRINNVKKVHTFL